MSEDSKPNPTPDRDFEPVDDPKEILRFFREAGTSSPSTMMWVKGQQFMIHSHIAHYSDVEKSFYIWIPKETKPESLTEALQQQKTNECIFSLSLSTVSIFFKAEYLKADEAGFQFKIPKQVFKIQRRKAIRAQVPFGYVMKIEFEDALAPGTMITKKIMDISAGGLAFNTEIAEAAKYTPGLVLKNVSFTVRRRKITLTAEVRYSKPIPAEQKFTGLKVGIQFKDIKEADANWISAYTLEETQRHYERWGHRTE